MKRVTPRSKRPDTLFTEPTLFRSNAVIDEVLDDRLCATFRELLVVAVRTDAVGVTRHFDLHVRILLEDVGRPVEDGLRVRTQARLVELEGHALEVADLVERAAIAVAARAGRGVRALVGAEIGRAPV